VPPLLVQGGIVSVPEMNGQPAAGETDLGIQLMQESLGTALMIVQKIKALESGAEAHDWAAAVLNLAQTVALMDPTRDTQGIPIQHAVEMQKLKSDAELEKVKAQSQAAASKPTPKKTVTAKRSGGQTTYSVEG